MAPENDLDGTDIDDNDPKAPSQLREALKRAGEKASKVPQLEKELAAVKAGIDTESRMGAAWLAGYEGDLSDKDAMIADARDFGIPIGAPAAAATAGEVTTGDGTVTTEDTGSAARQALLDGAKPSSAVVGDPRQEALDLARGGMEKGDTYAKGAGKAIHAMSVAVQEGRLAPLPANGVPAPVE